MSLLLDSAFGLSAVQLLFYIPAELVVIAASLFLFDIKKRALFSAVVFALFVANTFAAPHLPSALAVFAGAAVLVVPQLLFSKDSFARKAFTAVVVQIALVIAEVPPSLYWIGITDLAPTSPQAITGYTEYLLFARVMHVVSLALLLLGVHRAQQAITGHRTDRGAQLFIWLLLLQYLMIGLVVYTMELNQAFSERAALGLSIICLICVVADIVCFILLDHYNRRERNLWRMAYSQNELDRYLKAYEKIEREVSLLASVRHDLRNQMNVIMYFVEKRDAASARDHVREMIAGLDTVELAAASEEEVSLSSAGEEACGFREGGLRPEDSISGAQLLEGEGFALSSSGRSVRAVRMGALMVFPLSQALTATFLFFFASSAYLPVWFYVLNVVACALCFVADVVLYYYIDIAFKQGDVETKAHFLESQAKLQKRYYERLAFELEEARRSRQDLRDALVGLEGRLSRGDEVDASAVFESVVLSPVFKESRFCENRVVNALVSIKAAACAEEDVSFDCLIAVPEDTSVSTVDLCALFSNMLDNALQSCRQVGEGKRFIKLRATQTAGVLAVTMENSCNLMAEMASGREEEDLSVSEAWDLARWAGAAPGKRKSRADHARKVGSMVRPHGWGLRILRDMAERYNGTFEAAYEEGGRFRTSVMLVLDASGV